MKNSSLLDPTPAKELIHHAKTGRLVRVESGGIPVVDYSGNEFGPLQARTIVNSGQPGDTVLLIFEDLDPRRPVIVGIVRDRFQESHPRNVKLAAREVVMEATDELSLRCGESSLTLRRDGKTILKGRDLVSRASRTNRVRGATVQIN